MAGHEPELTTEQWRADFITRRVHRGLQRLVGELGISDEELRQLGDTHFKDQAAFLQTTFPNLPALGQLSEVRERLRRRGQDCGLDALTVSTWQEEACEDKLFEEEEDPYWWRECPESLCFDLSCTAEENLTAGAPPTLQWWDAEKVAESGAFIAITKPAGMFVVTDERGLWEESPTNFIHVAHRRIDMLPAGASPARVLQQQRHVMVSQSLAFESKSWAAFRHFVCQNSGLDNVGFALCSGCADEEVAGCKESQGSPAVTWYSALRHYCVPATGRLAFWGRDRWFTLVQLKILTGRTHQIRLHMAFLGHPPLAGDTRQPEARRRLLEEIRGGPASSVAYGALRNAPCALRGDREVVLAAVARDGSALQFAADALKGDREVVLAAVEHDGWALEFATDALKGDREVVRAAVEQDGWALEFAADEMRGDREVVLAAVKQSGRAFKHAADALREDRDFVLAAVKEDGTALSFASEELRADRSFLLEAVEATCAWWLVNLAAEELRADEGFADRCKAAAGTGLVFTYYDSYSCSDNMRRCFPTAGASVPGGAAYERVMKELKSASHGGTATVWFDEQPVFGHGADNGNWSHPSSDCGRDRVPVPPMEARDAKWLSTVDSRSTSLEPEVGKAYPCWCCHWLREVRKHHQAGEVICCAVSNIYDRAWVEDFGAGSSELADADAEKFGLPQEHFKHGKPASWGEGTICISGETYQRRAPVHPRTAKPLGLGCRWERQALDGMEFPVYAFFMP
ncbi:truC [Symbiodinium natans]|uniref:TruC protein n=1 Tax=Symbiodinium natans TaxID=878477 RepID=A0A812QGJ0_9DINO|nr:truC [Symbiodinium natans]